ncbi:PIG-L family deacetylase [Pseudomonas fluorescens]|jgi:LmbE family N-acetylglucosaminyl deacetylase|uniref:PIG-L family deacetylase n=1 Tax=Pseudomonas fluorescens TaxID=294 RepID=A0A7M2J358_PSEFL|nr:MULTISPECIES: PIG-L family deacetylase [Pseudomonas]QOU03679.1 PIG-L family deacetylase [Pseudomonas fluorescens]WEX14290.1 PIG-L family deacetylase [Pseudomonas sp. G11]WLD65981.1 PIG-L family deacetylase [Pseudomonas sp. OVF7]
MKLASIFFMPHQDDEFGLFHQIEQALAAGRWVRCIYVTDGSATADPDRRDHESRTVLQKLGVATDDIVFIGRQLSIIDGQLHRHIDVFVDWLDCFLNDHPTLHACFVPAWEGGHPDHDLLHAIVVELLAVRTHSATVWQYPLYNARNCSGPLFRVLSPLPENGPIEQQSITWRARFFYIRLCLSYPSQWRSWLGLFPFVGGHYFYYGVQSLQGVNRHRLTQPPHQQPLYYEKRGFLDWPTMCSAIEQLHKKLSRLG